LGTSLAYWVEPNDPADWQRYGFGLTRMPGSLSRLEVLEHYTSRTHQDQSSFVFYYAYGLFKVAVIVQQIYFRYRKGLTRDPRFANLGHLVVACGNLAQRAIEKARIDDLGTER
ncbi:MAG: phosphotransferase family protein, partial [Pyrinomonadaceae bacterium]